MLIVGLTGGIGCGKSLVSDLFHDLFNIPIVDADSIARNLTQTRHVLDIISQQIGEEYIDDNNQLAREKIRQAIFADASIRKNLENILHPLVYDEISNKFLDRILVVDCTVDEQIARVMQRDQCSKSQVENIIATQIDRNSRLSLADDILENSDDIKSVHQKVALLHDKYIELSKSKK